MVIKQVKICLRKKTGNYTKSMFSIIKGSDFKHFVEGLIAIIKDTANKKFGREN